MQRVCGIINPYQKITIAVLHHKLTSPDLRDGCHPSFKMLRRQGSYWFKGSHQVFLGLADCCSLWGRAWQAVGAEYPGGRCTQAASLCSHGSVPSLQTARIPDAGKTPHCVRSPSASLVARATPEWSKWFVTVPSSWALNRTINLCLQGLCF